MQANALTGQRLEPSDCARAIIPGDYLRFANDQEQRAKRFREMAPGFDAARDRLLLQDHAEQLEHEAVALRSAAMEVRRDADW